MPSVSQKVEGPGKAALDYISSISNTHSAIKRSNLPAPDQDKPVENARLAAFETVEEHETWERILLTSGVELNYRKVTDPAIQAKIEELVKFALLLFKNEKG